MKSAALRRRVVAGLSVLAMGALLNTASGATIVWDGLDTVVPDNVHWTVPGNWNPDGAPTPGVDDLRFPSTTGNRVTNNDFAANSQFNGIDLAGAAYTLAGNAINLGGNVNQSAVGSGDNIISLNMALLQDTTITVSGTLRLRPDGDISGNFGVTKEGTGNLRISALKKTYTGNTTINNGMIELINSDFLPSGAGKGNVIINSPGILTSNNATYTINGLSGNGTITKTGSGSRIMTLGDGNGSGVFTGTVTQSAGTFNVTKIGSGSQTFGGTYGYTGTTAINAGTFLVNGTHTGGGGNYTVAVGATLGGTGVINLTTGVVTINGTLAPGQSPGSLDIDNALTFGTNSTYSVGLEGNTPGDGTGFYDQVNVTDATAALTVGANVTLSAALNNGFGPSASDIFYILTRADAGVTNTFASLSEGATVSLGGGYSGQITYLANWAGNQAGSSLTGGNDVAIYNVTGVPEPASLAMLALGALACTRRRRA